MGINSMMNNIRVDVAFFSKVVRLILLTFLLTGITFAHAAWHPIDIQDERVLLDPPHIYAKGNTLYFDGKIDEDTDTVVIALIKKNNIRTISINSIGGAIVPAMKIGLIIYQRKIDIEIRSVCASACANYIFTAGKNKKLTPDSYLLWHGSAHSPKAEFTIDYSQEKIARKQFFSAPEFIAMKKWNVIFTTPLACSIKSVFVRNA